MAKADEIKINSAQRLFTLFLELHFHESYGAHIYMFLIFTQIC